jgi:tetratricopeptide (TPR) repeat protein
MRFSHSLVLAAGVLVLVVGGVAAAQPASSPLPGRHPAYLHALSDLRFARALLDRPDGGELYQQEKDARHELDKAIDDIKRAAAYDSKDLNEHPPIDRTLPWAGRLHKALELINQAHREVNQPEEDPAAQPSQQLALEHIDKARFHVKEAIEIVR